MRSARFFALAALATVMASCADGRTPSSGVPDATLRAVHAAAKLDGGAPFSFDAALDEHGAPTGSWREEVTAGVFVDVAVSCLTIVGSEVWAAGAVSSSDDPRLVGRSASIHLSNVGTSAARTSYTLLGGDGSCEPAPIPTPGRLAQ